MKTNIKSLLAIASFALAFGAFAFLPSQQASAKIDIQVCPGNGATCATAETSDGTTVKVEKAQGGAGAIVEME